MGEAFKNLPHPRALAFLGDAVYELHIREMAVGRNYSQSRDLHDFTTARAKASAQATLLQLLQDELTEDEREIVRQGRNLSVSAGRRSEQATYRQATGFETLIGALHLADRERLAALWQLAKPALESIVEQAAHRIEGQAAEVADTGDELA